jgi:hypothetical protein
MHAETTRLADKTIAFSEHEVFKDHVKSILRIRSAQPYPPMVGTPYRTYITSFELSSIEILVCIY